MPDIGELFRELGAETRTPAPAHAQAPRELEPAQRSSAGTAQSAATRLRACCAAANACSSSAARMGRIFGTNAGASPVPARTCAKPGWPSHDPGRRLQAAGERASSILGAPAWRHPAPARTSQVAARASWAAHCMRSVRWRRWPGATRSSSNRDPGRSCAGSARSQPGNRLRAILADGELPLARRRRRLTHGDSDAHNRGVARQYQGAFPAPAGQALSQRKPSAQVESLTSITSRSTQAGIAGLAIQTQSTRMECCA